MVATMDSNVRKRGGLKSVMDYPTIGKEVARVVATTPLREIDHISVTKAGSNPQTSLDLEADRYLKQHLVRILDIPIASEEDSITTMRSAGLCWVVDPIDGTINALAGTDDFAISVALVDASRSTSILGVVYLPRTRRMYTAVAEHGAELNGRPLGGIASQRSPADRTYRLSSFGVPSDSPRVAARMSEALRRLYQTNWVTRQSGSASIDICRVADGTWSAFFEYRLKYWDFAAAVALAAEAGCQVRVVPVAPAGRGDVPLEYDVLIARNADVLEQVAACTGIRATRA